MSQQIEKAPKLIELNEDEIQKPQGEKISLLGFSVEALKEVTRRLYESGYTELVQY